MWLNEKFVEIILKLFETLYLSLIKPFIGLLSLKDLVYGNSADEELIYSTFKPSDISNIVEPGYILFMGLAFFFVTAFIVLAGMRISGSSINPMTRNYMINFGLDLLLVTLLLWHFPTIFDFLFKINDSIINVFSQAHEGDFLEFAQSADEFTDNDSVIGDILVFLVLLGLAIWGNFYYTMRKLTLIIFLIISPLMAALWLSPQTKGITAAWFKELLGTIFVQSIHALCFWIIFALSSGTANIIESVILYVVFIPVAEGLRSMFGLGGQMHNNLSKAGAMLGLASLGAMYGSVKGALKDQSVMSTLKGAYDGLKSRGQGSTNGNGNGDPDENGKSTIASNLGTDIGTTSRAERLLKAGQITSKAGKAVLGSAGAIAGAPLGPAGSILLSTAGFEAGGVVGGLAGRTGYAALSKTKDGIKKGLQNGKEAFGKGSEKQATDALAEDIASQNLEKWENATKDSMMFDLKEKFPEATPEQLDNYYDIEKNKTKDAFKKQAIRSLTGAKEKDGFAHANDLVDAATDSAVQSWAAENKDAIIADELAKNPNATTADLDKAFATRVSEQRAKFRDIAVQTAEKVGGGKELGNALLDKKEFANDFSSQLASNQKQDFINKEMKMNPNLTNDEAETLYADQIGERSAKLKILKDTNKGLSSVDGARYFSKSGINRDLVASQMAEDMTGQQKQSFIAHQISNGMSDVEAKVAWDTQSKDAYGKNYDVAVKQLNDTKSPKQVSFATRSLKGAGAFIGGATGVTTAIEAASTAASNIGISTQETMNAINDSGVTGVQKVVQQVKGIGRGVTQGIQQNMVQTLGGGDAVLAQNVATKGVAYAGGVLLGVGGYQKAAQFASKLNPLNSVVNQQTKEVSQIEQEVQTVQLADGTSMPKKGALRQVVTSDQSYVEMTDKTGNVQIVSRIGSGDSSLPNGQKIYQDLSVQNGSLVPEKIPGTNNSFYQMDSGGGRVMSNRQINTNPNRLMAQHSTVKPEMEYQPFNQKVDSGQFDISEIKRTSNETIHYVNERNRSYIVSKGSDGREYRFSSYGQGDTSLPPGTSRITECKISGSLLVPQRSVVRTNGEEKQVSTPTHLDPNELIPPKPNARFEKRQRIDRDRHFSF